LGQVAGSCGQNNEPLGFVEYGKCLDQMSFSRSLPWSFSSSDNNNNNNSNNNVRV
jgi:hypothetical protein